MTREEFTERIIDMQDKLYRISYGMLHNPIDQEDAVQESIKKALIKRSSLRSDEYMQTWMIRILINVCHDMVKKRKREFPTEEIKIIIPPKGNSVMVEAFAEIEEKLRIPLVLHYIEGYTVRETAKILRIPEGTIKSRLMKGRSTLKIILEEGGLEYDRV